MTYNESVMHSAASRSRKHFEASARECAQLCAADPTCCSWAYFPPARPTDRPAEGSTTSTERCALKNGVPPALPSDLVWSGIARSKVLNGSELLPICGGGPAFPTADFLRPRYHHSPPCVHQSGWHDITAALSYKGKYHVFMGCPGGDGWFHSVSTDLVHFKGLNIGPRGRKETHAGMLSDHDAPCSGFIVLDDDGVPCAGFRQCGSTRGVAGGQPWDVPLELRCASNDELTEWGPSIWLYDVFFWRALAYDPIRPWKDLDGYWYSGVSLDACNRTCFSHPQGCGCAGGEVPLWRSPALHGPRANWTRVSTPLIQTNRSYPCDRIGRCRGLISREFITSNYFGQVAGDPRRGASRVFTANNYAPDPVHLGPGTAFWIGSQANGTTLDVDYTDPHATGVLDFGDFTMARTLSPSDQVTEAGRRTLLGWIGGCASNAQQARGAQSLPRDLSFAPSGQLLQSFVPELQSLRKPETYRRHTLGSGLVASSLQLEVVGRFTLVADQTKSLGVVGFTVLGSADGSESTFVGVDAQSRIVMVNSTNQGVYNLANETGLSAPLLGDGSSVLIHCFVDGSVLEVIFDNATAFSVRISPTSASNTYLGVRGSGALSAVVESWELRDAS